MIPRIFFIISFSFLISNFSFFIPYSFSQHEAHQKQEKPVYYCPMHPSYTSDKPGDCPICNMKLVLKEEVREKAKEDSSLTAKGGLSPAKEKDLQEVCVEHNCTMEGCPMHVRVNIKPGERLICPVCGEVISTAAGKVVEIGKASVRPFRPVMVSAKKQQLIGVRTEEVKRMPLSKTIRAAGRIAYDPELAIAQEEFIQALKNEENLKSSSLAERAESLTGASRRRLKLLGMSDEQIDTIKEKRAPKLTFICRRKGKTFGLIYLFMNMR